MHCLKKYEFCLSLSEPKIVWVGGGVPPSVADISLFRGGKPNEEWDQNSLYHQIPEGKAVIADNGLTGEPDKILCHSDLLPEELQDYISKAKARQETFHTRLKSFAILYHRFRHGKSTEEKIALHKMAVEAISTLIQYDYENGHPPFDMPLEPKV